MSPRRRRRQRRNTNARPTPARWQQSGAGRAFRGVACDISNGYYIPMMLIHTPTENEGQASMGYEELFTAADAAEAVRDAANLELRRAWDIEDAGAAPNDVTDRAIARLETAAAKANDDLAAANRAAIAAWKAAGSPLPGDTDTNTEAN